MTADLWDFAEVEPVYSRLRPLTPYGWEALSRRRILSDPGELKRRYDRVETAAALLAGDSAIADRIRYHLGRLPLLLPPIHAAAADLFLIKKFLVNYRALAGVLDAPTREKFGITWQSEALLQALNTDDAGGESFYLADRCDPELAAIRKQLRELDASLQAVRAAALESLRVRHKLDFAGRDFLVIDIRRASELGSHDVFLEPFDSRQTIVRPVLPPEYFELLAKREERLGCEHDIEEKILAQLASRAAEENHALHAYTRAVEALDVALAAAELADSLRMSRPELSAGGASIEIVAGRLVPLEENCRQRQIEYRPLTVRLDTPHAVLHGSNMTGKSVVLKTVANLQILAQLGLFVPAERFRTVIFDRVFFIGPSQRDEAHGLSSFGQDIVALREALACHCSGSTAHPGTLLTRPWHTCTQQWYTSGGSSLFLLDDFGGTTNPREAAALTAGLLKLLSTTARTYSLVATHYSGLPAFENVRVWRMRGIDWEKLGRLCQFSASSDQPGPLLKDQWHKDLAARVQIINRCVPYEMAPDTGKDADQDAIRIAEMLGLDEAIIACARGYLRGDLVERE